MPPNIVRVSLDILPFEGLACREAALKPEATETV